MAEAIPTLKTLDEFIETLAAQRGLHRKVRLLGHYWRQVRDLPSEDRQRIALALGSESAWKRLEKLFGADGHLSEGELTVQRALRRVGTADPAELRALAERLRSGDYAEVGAELLDAVGEALDAEVGVEPETQGAPAPEPESVLQPAIEPTPEPMAAAEPEPELELESGPEAELDPEPKPGPEPESTQETETRPVDEVPAMPPLPPLPPAAVGPLPDVRARAERLRLVTASGTGWRRRRLLGELIRERELDGLDEALELAVLLESDVQRAWCLGDLVQHWPLDEGQVQEVLDAAPSASVRSRLQARYERAELLRERGRAH